jgi:hypothetical protein
VTESAWQVFDGVLGGLLVGFRIAALCKVRTRNAAENTDELLHLGVVHAACGHSLHRERHGDRTTVVGS